MNYKAKKLSNQNMEECTLLYKAVFNAEPWNDGWEYKDAKERLTDIFSNRKFLGIGIYDDDQKLIGFLLGHIERWLTSNHFYLNEMCVKTELQSNGIGSRLLSEFEITCKEHNISRIYLLTAREGQAEAFYNKNGFYKSPKMMMMAKRLEG
ncbi:GNAT family N-acetyltransferase [Gracilibacillus salinarum]|uniref:GNAT family N-acetyltransferase n=1 Tax=Gracilibacillus salinarum TaxID=2932255 RepID=A0ABY4GGQ7_9BACI|nr:GNAT family N-acetyltransferase [Gracilibacillus salinarum]UOQ83442.1 GNAT family N-acetyltransferase [Gracilibacillus salinarum]